MLVDASGAPASGWSGPLVEPCRAMLADAFPDTPADAWSIAECGDLGVLASDGVDDFAVTGDGSIWHVDACGWTLLADGQ